MSTKKIDYKTLSSELDEIVSSLQSDTLDVEAAVKLYERGTVIVAELQNYLKEAENKVTKIKADFS